MAGDPHKTPIDDGFFDAAVSGALTVKDLSETVGHLVNPKFQIPRCWIIESEHC